MAPPKIGITGEHVLPLVNQVRQTGARAHSLVAGSADRNRISSRIVFSGLVGGIHSTNFRKNACTCR